jgi:photosystem II stability/assembly factor-like uncharacterized protein
MRAELSLFALALSASCGGTSVAPPADDTDDTIAAPATPDAAPQTALDASREAGAQARDAAAHPIDSGPRFAKWTNVTSNLAGLPTHAPCGNLSTLAVVPGKDEIIAAVANGGHISDQGGLWATTDGGAKWSQMGTGAGSEIIDNNPYAITFDPKNADIFWESGQYGQYGVYKTTDGGSSFHHLEVAPPGSQTAIDFGDPARKTIVVGTVEASQIVWKSTDGGDTWDNIGANLPSGTNFSTDPVVLSPTAFLVVCSGWGKGTTDGTYRTTDGGVSWTLVSTMAGNYPALVASDGTLYWSLAWNGGLIRSTDQGVTWTKVVGSGVITSDTPFELPDHRLVAVSPNQSLLVSADRGATWKPFLDPIPIQPKAEGRYAVVYDEPRNSVFVSKWDCQASMPDDAVWRYDLP